MQSYHCSTALESLFHSQPQIDKDSTSAPSAFSKKKLLSSWNISVRPGVSGHDRGSRYGRGDGEKAAASNVSIASEREMSAFGMGFGGGPGGLGGMGAPRGFEEQYHCYPVSFQVNRDRQRGREINDEGRARTQPS